LECLKKAYDPEKLTDEVRDGIAGTPERKRLGIRPAPGG
jgi:hypothetical protein